MFMSFSFGQWSIERGSDVCSRVSVPTFMQPYVHKADEYGDKALSALDEKFPVTKKPTDELVHDARSLAMRPKEHFVEVYRDEQQKAGDGLVASGTALVYTTVAIGAEICGKALSYLRGQQSAASQQTAASGNSRKQNGHTGNSNGNGSKGSGKSNGSGH